MSQLYTPKITTRDARGHDVARFVEIDEHSFDAHWDRYKFERYIGRDGWGLWACDWSGSTVGYLLYEASGSSLHIHRLAVNANARRHGVASRLVRDLLGRRTNYRPKVRVHIPLLNQPALALFKELKFVAAGVKPLHDDELVVMWSRLPVTLPDVRRELSVNRIASAMEEYPYWGPSLIEKEKSEQEVNRD